MVTGLGSAKDLASGKKGAFYNTLEEFHKHWERIDILAPRDKNEVSRDRVLFGNVFIHVSPWPLIFHPFWFLKKGREIHREQKFDTMTVQDFPPFYNGIGARFLWQKIKVPYILEIHHIPGYPKASNLKEKIYANKIIWMLYWKVFSSKATAVRTVNQKQTPEFLKNIGIPKNKIIYIPSMYVDLEVFKLLDLPKEYNLIFVGRLAENKGISLFLEAVKILNTKAIVVGDGPLRDWTQLQITKHKLPITSFGWANNSQEIAKLLNQSKILIMSSYNEGGPRVVLEAMACGVPVLTTNVGLMPDFADKNTVKIIDWSVKDIVSKAKELLENENERNRLKQAGLKAVKQFEKKEMIKNYAEKIKVICK